MAAGSTLCFRDRPLLPGRLHGLTGTLREGLGHYDAQQYPSRTLWFGQDHSVTCHTILAFALWALGYLEQALHRDREGLILARQLGHPFSLAFAISHVAVLHAALRERQAAQAMAEAALTFAEGQGLAFWLARGRSRRRCDVAIRGDRETGIAQMRQGVETTHSPGAAVGRSGFLNLLMLRPPGDDTLMSARQLTPILPAMTLAEAL